MRRSTVAHFACKVRGTNVELASAVDRSQFYRSESWPLTSPHDRGPHFARKVSYNAFAPDFAPYSWRSLCEQSELHLPLKGAHI